MLKAKLRRRANTPGLVRMRERSSLPLLFHPLSPLEPRMGFCCQAVISDLLAYYPGVIESVVRARCPLCGSSAASPRIRSDLDRSGPQSLMLEGQGSEEWDSSWERGIVQPRFQSVTIRPGSGKPTWCVGLRIGLRAFGFSVSPP